MIHVPYARIAYNAGLCVALVFFPWWVTFVLAIIGMVVWKRYGEGIVAGVMLDVVYGVPFAYPWMPIPVLHTMLFFAVYAIICAVKTRMR